jgi:primosomal protein N' (replication factor Y) (superfamily II helicase)
MNPDTSSTPLCWRVALLGPPYATLTYEEPEHPGPGAFCPGQRVAVPLGRSLRIGLLLGAEEDPPGCGLKPILWPLDRVPSVDGLHLEMAQDLAVRHLQEPGRILASFLPAGLRTAKVELEVDGPEPYRLKLPRLLSMEPECLAELGGHWREGRMRVRTAVRRPEPNVHLCIDPPWPIRPGAQRQHRILDLLWNDGPMPVTRISRTLGPGVPQGLKPLVSRGLVRMVDGVQEEVEAGGEDEPFLALTPTPEQERALGVLTAELEGGTPRVSILHGVTGSGKTYLYLRLARSCLDRGRSVLILCPEVALAYQMWRVAARDLPGARTLLHHGYQDVRQRERTYLGLVESRDPVLVVGTRSALFLPVPDLGLIVLDEEHDSSFKQDEKLVYQAKELAWFMARANQAMLLLGSATPDVKTFYAAESGSIGQVRLSERVSGRPLPRIEVLNLLENPAGDGGLSQLSREALQDTLDRGEQVMIMQNRRGYAPLVYCVDCGHVARCAACEVGLTYHKGLERLLCHYCGAFLDFPLICPGCGGCHFLPLGEGTEQVEEYLRRSFPAAGTLRLDRDSTRRKGRLAEILDDFAMSRAKILVGTQMISKGHDFPNVTLVVVVDGDLGLNLPDYRATERTFQLLVQVAGRAGRGDKPGRVLIQTRNPSHYCWGFVSTSDYEGFYAQELQRRKALGYPPFVKLGLVRMSFPEKWPHGPEALGEAARRLHARGRECGLKVLGPAPAPLARLRGRLRHHCLLKGQDWKAIRAAFSAVMPLSGPKHPFRIQLDLDPVNML